MWKKSLLALKRDLIKIQQKESFKLSYEDLYRRTYEIVRQRKFLELYETIRELIYNHIENIRNKIIRDIEQNNVNAIVREWEDFLMCTKIFRDVLMFLDQAYIVKVNLDSIYDLSLSIFRDELLRHNPIKNWIQNTLLGMITEKRNGQAINNLFFKSIIDILVVLSKLENSNVEYKTIFEESFLEGSTVYYQQEAQKLLSSPCTDIFMYIKNYEERKLQEKDLAEKLLQSSTKAPLLKILEDCLIKAHLNKIVELKNGLKYILETGFTTELTLIYEWYEKFEQKQQFEEMVTNIYHEYGLSIVDRDIPNTDVSKIIEVLLKLKNKFTLYCKTCFKNNGTLNRNINKYFSMIFNQNPRMSEFLSMHIHNILRDKKKHTEDQFENKIEEVMQLFLILVNKDTFERFYKSYLTRRLLLTPNLDIERMILTKFKTECGRSYTSNMETMVNDIEISSTHMDMFNNEIYFKDEYLTEIDFNVTVAQSGAWSLLQFPQCILPPAPSTLFERYKTFYYDKHSGRKLNIQYNYGNCILKGNFYKNKNNPVLKDRSIIFDVSNLQMMILLLFNDEDNLTVSEICEKTRIPKKFVISSLNPIVLGKLCHRVLKRDGKFPPQTPLNGDSIISINEEYYSKHPNKTKLPYSAHQKEDDDYEREAIENRTNRDRGYEIEACIVRIMKARKVLQHREIVSEVIEQLKYRFKPDVKSIDAHIANLVDKEYIEKVEADSNQYAYIQ